MDQTDAIARIDAALARFKESVYTVAGSDHKVGNLAAVPSDPRRWIPTLAVLAQLDISPNDTVSSTLERLDAVFKDKTSALHLIRLIKGQFTALAEMAAEANLDLFRTHSMGQTAFTPDKFMSDLTWERLQLDDRVRNVLSFSQKLASKCSALLWNCLDQPKRTVSGDDIKLAHRIAGDAAQSARAFVSSLFALRDDWSHYYSVLETVVGTIHRLQKAVAEVASGWVTAATYNVFTTVTIVQGALTAEQKAENKATLGMDLTLWGMSEPFVARVNAEAATVFMERRDDLLRAIQGALRVIETSLPWRDTERASTQVVGWRANVGAAVHPQADADVASQVDQARRSRRCFATSQEEVMRDISDSEKVFIAKCAAGENSSISMLRRVDGEFNAGLKLAEEFKKLDVLRECKRGTAALGELVAKYARETATVLPCAMSMKKFFEPVTGEHVSGNMNTLRDTLSGDSDNAWLFRPRGSTPRAAEMRIAVRAWLRAMLNDSMQPFNPDIEWRIGQTVPEFAARMRAAFIIWGLSNTPRNEILML